MTMNEKGKDGSNRKLPAGLKSTFSGNRLMRFCWVGVLIFIAYFYLIRMPSVSDINAEAAVTPLTVGYMEMARHNGQASDDFFKNSPLLEDLKREDPWAYAYYGQRFVLEYMSKAAPLLNIMYIPFVSWGGVGTRTVMAYSLFFTMLAFLLTFIVARMIFGDWQALLAVFLLASNLIWMIHVRVAYSAWMPSVCLLLGVFIIMHFYMRTGHMRYVIAVGVLLGLLYLLGWLSIVVGFCMVVISILSVWKRRRAMILVDGTVVGCVALLLIAGVVWLYSLLYGFNVYSIHETMLAGLTGRYGQGAVPGFSPSLWGRLIYALNCLFLDSRQVDHLDKCLQGVPGLSPFFSAFLVLGFIFILQKREPGKIFVVVWLLAVFLFLVGIYLYAHRYMLLAFPAMAMIAAHGMVGLVEFTRARLHGRAIIPVLSSVLGLLLLASCVITCRQFSVDYLTQKPPDFEEDRMRGQEDLAKWISCRYNPDNTFVVLGDPIFFNSICFLFHTFDRPYRFVYWSNHFRDQADAVAFRDWQQKVKESGKLPLFVFSLRLYGPDPKGRCMNDWSLFRSAYPALRPVFLYSYAQRPAMFAAFEVPE